MVLGNDAYSTSIMAEMVSRAQKKVTVGSLWVSLDQLALRKIIEKRSVKNEDQQGGRPRIYYRLTRLGLDQLKQLQQYHLRVWNDVPVLDSYEV